MNHRNANPEHFHRAVEHGLAMAAAGAGLSMLDVMSRGCASRGLADASNGYSHAKLRLMALAPREAA